MAKKSPTKEEVKKATFKDILELDFLSNCMFKVFRFEIQTLTD